MLPLKQTVLVICGPTAVGKTAVAVKLAQQLQTKIISADSRQCYRELNIGVAKPSAAELSLIPHYFINSHTIHEGVNAAMFEAYAINATQEIFEQNNIAIMVGGTGLYIKAFTEGLDAIPSTPAEIRESINNNYKQNGLDWLQNEVREKDITYWKTAEQKNPHRLIRALEVVTSTGKSINDFQHSEKVIRPFNIIKIGLHLPKMDLHNNINSRVDRMLENGLIEEVKGLVPYKDFKALQTVGYAEVFQFLSSEITLEQMIGNIKTNTRRYAKRQVTWFKKETETWFDANEIGYRNLYEFLKEKIR